MDIAGGILSADIVADNRPYCRGGTKYLPPPTIPPYSCRFCCPSRVSSAASPLMLRRRLLPLPLLIDGMISGGPSKVGIVRTPSYALASAFIAVDAGIHGYWGSSGLPRMIVHCSDEGIVQHYSSFSYPPTRLLG